MTNGIALAPPPTDEEIRRSFVEQERLNKSAPFRWREEFARIISGREAVNSDVDGVPSVKSVAKERAGVVGRRLMLASIIAGVAFLATSGLGEAQSAKDAISFDTGWFSKQFNQFLDPKALGDGIIGAGAKLSGGLKDFALMLLAALTIISGVQEAMKYFLEGRAHHHPPSVIVGDVLMPMTLAGGFILNYDFLVVAPIKGLMNMMINLVGGQAYVSVGTTFLDLIGSLVEMIVRMFASYDGTSPWSMFTSSVSNFIPNAIATFVLIACIVIVLWAAAELAVSIMKGFFMMAVGFALGPLFIATSVHTWTRDFFGKWFGFMIASSFIAGLGVLIATLCSGMITSIAAQLGGKGAAFTMTTAIFVALGVWIVKELMSEIPTIASALVPGHIGVKGGGIANFAQGVMKTTPTSLSKVASSAGRGSMRTANATMAHIAHALGKGATNVATGATGRLLSEKAATNLVGFGYKAEAFRNGRATAAMSHAQTQPEMNALYNDVKKWGAPKKS